MQPITIIVELTYFNCNIYQSCFFSAFLTLSFILLHTFWGVIFFNGLDKKQYYMVALVVGSHMLLSCLVSQDQNNMKRHYQYTCIFTSLSIFPFSSEEQLQINEKFDNLTIDKLRTVHQFLLQNNVIEMYLEYFKNLIHCQTNLTQIIGHFFLQFVTFVMSS